MIRNPKTLLQFLKLQFRLAGNLSHKLNTEPDPKRGFHPQSATATVAKGDVLVAASIHIELQDSYLNYIVCM